MIFSSLGTSKGQCDALDSNQSIISRRTLRVGREGRRLHTLRKCGASGPDQALRRAPQIFRQRAIGQCLCQMQPADLFRAVEIGQRARDAQHAVIAARRQLHGFGGIAQQLLALRVLVPAHSFAKYAPGGRTLMPP
jgi:hypothetical protein